MLDDGKVMEDILLEPQFEGEGSTAVMMLKLALRNLLGAGMKTWLTVGVLSLAFVTIIALQGVYEGMNQQASEAMVAAEIGGGQYWHEKYDPQNPFDLPDAHGPVPAALGQLAARDQATAILAVQGFMYVAGGLRPVLLKGIDPKQHVLTLPAAALGDATGAEVPALIGNRMARDTGLKVGDVATVRWRDARGTFDAQEIGLLES